MLCGWDDGVQGRLFGTGKSGNVLCSMEMGGAALGGGGGVGDLVMRESNGFAEYGC